MGVVGGRGTCKPDWLSSLGLLPLSCTALLRPPSCPSRKSTNRFIDFVPRLVGLGILPRVRFFQLAEVARTPWLDPYVAGGILAAKALSEGDWRIGKGALAGWADRALSSLSNTGAKVLRVGSGNEVRSTSNQILVFRLLFAYIFRFFFICHRCVQRVDVRSRRPTFDMSNVVPEGLLLLLLFIVNHSVCMQPLGVLGYLRRPCATTYFPPAPAPTDYRLFSERSAVGATATLPPAPQRSTQ